MRDDTVLIDSDALIGWQIIQDAHHAEAVHGFEWMITHQIKPVVTTLVVTETANLLSRRYSLEDAKRFLRAIASVPIIPIDNELYQETRNLFLEQQRSKTSFVDMANVVVMRRYSIGAIFAFDTVYDRDFHLHTLSAA